MFLAIFGKHDITAYTPVGLNMKAIPNFFAHQTSKLSSNFFGHVTSKPPTKLPSDMPTTDRQKNLKERGQSRGTSDVSVDKKAAVKTTKRQKRVEKRKQKKEEKRKHKKEEKKKKEKVSGIRKSGKTNFYA